MENIVLIKNMLDVEYRCSCLEKKIEDEIQMSISINNKEALEKKKLSIEDLNNQKDKLDLYLKTLREEYYVLLGHLSTEGLIKLESLVGKEQTVAEKTMVENKSIIKWISNKAKESYKSENFKDEAYYSSIIRKYKKETDELEAKDKMYRIVFDEILKEITSRNTLDKSIQ